MATVEELVVKATPEGIDETVEGLENMEAKTEESAESMEEQANEMGNLSGKFAGAMGAIAAGFAVVSGTLLSKVPVLGEAAAGLGAILSALGLKIDTVLRPAIQPLTDLFFKLAEKINDSDGATGKLIGVIGTAIAIIATIGGIILGVIGAFLALGGSMGTVVSVAGIVIGAIGSVIGTILSLPVILGVAIAALVAFVAAYLLNWRGTRDKTNKILGKIADIVKRKFKHFIKKAMEFLKVFVKIVKQKFTKIKSMIAMKLGEIVSNAKQSGKDLVSGFAQGIRDKISAATAAASELASKVRERLPSSPAQTGPLSDLDKTGPGMVDTFTAGVSDGISRIDSNLGEDSTNASTTGKALARNNGRTIIEIEGRQVERATRDFRSDGTDLRGRYG